MGKNTHTHTQLVSQLILEQQETPEKFWFLLQSQRGTETDAQAVGPAHSKS